MSFSDSLRQIHSAISSQSAAIDRKNISTTTGKTGHSGGTKRRA